MVIPIFLQITGEDIIALSQQQLKEFDIHMTAHMPSTSSGTVNEACSSVKENVNYEWSEAMTKFLLDHYFEGIKEVGPMKQFRNKKNMWEHITLVMNNHFYTNKTSTQVENRYKTVVRRKTQAVSNNHTSGAKRIRVDYEEELSKIAKIDDNIEPEVLKDQTTTIVNKKIEETKRKHVAEAYEAINKQKMDLKKKLHDEKEQNKERRHEEKMQLLKELINKNSLL